MYGAKQAKLTASTSRQLAYLGYSLAVDGDTVLVGAYGDNTVLGELGSGSAYVFDKPSGGWADGNETAKLTASDRQPSGYFGFSVALDGDTAVIGARQHNDPITGAGSGAAYVFTRQSGVWGEKAKLTPSDAAARDNFGVSVAVEGDTVVVGSWQDDDNGRNSGSAYVFEKPALGWARTFETLKLTAPDGAVNDRFGWSVAVDVDAVRGDLALVGAYSDDHDVNSDDSIDINAGSVHVLGIPDWKDIPNSMATTTAHTVTKELDNPNTDLTNGMAYNLQIRALNQSGAGPASDGVSETPLGPPAEPSLEAEAGDTQVTLSWTKHVPTDPVTIAAITGYRYEYSTDSDTGSGEIDNGEIDNSDAANLAYTVTGLENLTTYTFQIFAVNAIGETASNTRDATPASATPESPENLMADPGDTQVRLTWDDPDDSSIDKYEFRRTEGTQATDFIDTGDNKDEWTQVPDSNANTTGYTVTGLDNATPYAFQIRAWDGGADRKESDPATVTAMPTSAPPAAPTGLMADPDDSLVALTWEDPDDSTINHYEYRQKVEDPDNPNEFGDWMRITSSGPTTTEYTVTDLDNGTEYTFEVRAVESHNGTEEESDPSADSATPLPPVPGKPTDLSVTESSQRVTLTWQAPAGSVVDKYEVLHLQASALVNPGVTEGDKFGYSVAVDGDIAVVGAYRDGENDVTESGAAYVFTKSGGVVWDAGVKLTASDRAPYDNFGISVAVDGETVVVGAPGDDDNGTDSGSVYVFTNTNGVWSQAAKLTASDGATLDYFGQSVAVSGDTILVGAYLDDREETITDSELEDSGSAYVFTKPTSTGGWDDWEDLPQTDVGDQAEDKETLTHKLTASSDAADDDNFGTSVALDGDTAVIGAPGADDNDNGIDSGSAYVFTRDDQGNWDAGVELTADDGKPGDSFGVSVTVDGDTAVVGAYQHDPVAPDSNPNSPSYLLDAGAAYVFTKTAGTWSQSVKLTADDRAPGDYFGYSVAVDDGTVLVGAYQDDDKGTDSGSAYVFTRDSNVWRQTNKVTEDPGEAGGWFGYSVTVDAAAHTALVGAGSAHVMDIHDWAEVQGGPEHRSYTFTELTNDRTYDLQVRAVNIASAGDEAETEATPMVLRGGGAPGMKDGPGDGDDNNPPRFSEGDLTSRAVPEDAEIATKVGAPLEATDPDGNPLQFSLSGAGQDYFQVDSGTGQLTTATVLNYESQSTYSVQVRVQDGQGGIDDISVTIMVGDVDEPPAQPGAPQVSSTGLNGLTVSWTVPENRGPEITDYDVQYRATGGEFQDAGYDGTGTSLALNDLSPATGYEVQVRAVNAEGISPWSASGRGETGEVVVTPVPTPSPAITTTPGPTRAGAPTPTPGPGGASVGTPTPTPTVGPTGMPARAQTPGPVTATPPAVAAMIPTPTMTQAESASVREPTTAIPPAAESEQDIVRGFPIWLIAAIVVAILLAIILGYLGVRMLRRQPAT